jgi:hypothetical protein
MGRGLEQPVYLSNDSRFHEAEVRGGSKPRDGYALPLTR